MRVFITGGSGWIGSAVIPELLSSGHTVLALARSDASIKKLQSMGPQVEIIKGSLTDIDVLKQGASSCDGVIHLAFIHDFSRFAENAKIDLLAIEAMGSVLEGANKPFVTTSGTGLLIEGVVGTENDEGDSSPMKSMRKPSELATIALSAKGVRSSVVRLPPTVHGRGDHGFAAGLANAARARGESAYIGEGANHWPAVHRLDAAKVYRLALEKGVGGRRYHAVAEQGATTRAIAEAIGNTYNVPIVSKSVEEAAAHFGPLLGMLFAIDNIASNELTRKELGWQPTELSLVDDLQANYSAAYLEDTKY